MLAPDRDALAVRRAERQIDAPVRGAGSARDDRTDGAVDVRLRIVPRPVLAVPLSPASGRSVLPAAAAPAAAAPASRGLGRASARRRRAGGERARRPPPRSCAAPLACRAAPLFAPAARRRGSLRSRAAPTPARRRGRQTNRQPRRRAGRGRCRARPARGPRRRHAACRRWRWRAACGVPARGGARTAPRRRQPQGECLAPTG
mmetsp:Transcript_36054/g.107910  ORF Transcript_36054/g.107910 Transcript_36054/m.107910 type:complete len:203 (-) Transcript_36054:1094-1702(-)